MKQTFSWQDVINSFYHEYCTLAAEVGIDGKKLLSHLPASGELLTGKNVPVLSNDHRNKCSVLFYINTLANGNSWPYFKFMSFKHGGVHSVFNGLELIKNESSFNQHLVSSSPQAISQDDNNSTQSDEAWRKAQFWQSSEQFFKGKSAKDSAWLKKRLLGLATEDLLARVNLRVTDKGDLLAPIGHQQKGIVGFHKIFADAKQKRHHIIESGLLTGSAVIINQRSEINTPDIAIAEGLATALSIALAWSGIIYVALSAGNLAAVRKTLPQDKQVTFFADNDAWKPEVGNVGIEKATSAALKIDRVIFPTFAEQSKASKPTDFNDLLVLEGLEVLVSQIRKMQYL